MRLRATKTEMSDAGEDTDGMAESVSKLRNQVMALSGVDIQLSEDTYKDTYTILQEMSKVWDDLSDMDRANILELFFGKRQANIGAALLENFDTVEDVLSTSRNAEGSAEAENEKYLKSIQGHLDQMQAKWQALGATLADDFGLKTIIDLGGTIIDVIDGITSAFGSLGTIALPIVALLSKKGNIGKKNMPSYVATCRMSVA